MFVIGSRGSALALWQSNFIAGRLRALGVETRIEIIKTTGDHLQTASLVQAGGKGLFTKEIEEALLAGSIDIAVHSLKDLPTEHPPGLTIAAIPEREDPRDVMAGSTLRELPRAARVGTSSSRRTAQLRNLRSDLVFEPIRGNVDTRLRKLAEGQYSAIVLAAAGLHRLGFESQIAQAFEPTELCPAPGQGALAVQTRDAGDAREICVRLDHRDTNVCVTVERAVLAALGGGCQLPIGAYARLRASELEVFAAVASPDGSAVIRTVESAPREDAARLAESVARHLLERGARDLLSALA